MNFRNSVSSTLKAKFLSRLITPAGQDLALVRIDDLPAVCWDMVANNVHSARLPCVTVQSPRPEHFRFPIMPRKKPKPLGTNWTKISIRDYRDADPSRRILNAYRISQEVEQYSKDHDEDAAMSKLAAITGDWADARRLRRLHTLPEKGMIEKAVEHLKTKTTEVEKRRTTSIDGPKRVRRSPDADRFSYALGISRTHLLTLAGVPDRTKRNQLFRDSIKNGWTTAELKRQARGWGEKKRPVRPAELTYATVIKLDELAELLKRVSARKLPAATTKVKPTEQARVIKQCTGAIRKLRRLEKQIQPAIETLEAAKSLLK